MKKDSKSFSLFKVLFVILVFIAILTWIIPSGNFDEGPFQSLGIMRTSIYDFIMSYYYAGLYLLVEVTFLLCVGGFYGILSKSREYCSIVSFIAEKIKNKENIFMIIIGIFIALFTSINSHFLFCVIFIPFIVSILAKNGINKYKVFATTFGALMVGILGNTYNLYYSSIIQGIFPVTITDGIVWKFLVLGVAYFILMSFVLMKPDGPNVATEDIFLLVEENKKVKKLPVAIVLGIFAVISIFLYIPWKESFGVELFDKFYTNIMTFKVGNYPIFSYLFDNQLATYPNGSYERLFNVSLLMIITSFIVSKLSRMRINYSLVSFGNGVKRILKPISIFLLANSVFVLVYWSPIGATIVNALIPSGSSFNVFVLMLVGIILAILNMDHGYTLYSVGAYFSALYVANIIDAIFVLNTTYGLVQFIFPTSYLLFFALSYLDISYKDYLKNMWKFLLALIIAMFCVILMSVYFK